jgi:general secretion pathway protein L
MQSIGLVFKKEEMTIACLKQGIREMYLEGYRILPFLDLKDEEKEEAILYNLDRFFKTYKEGRDNLFIALPRDIALLQFLNLPIAVEEDLRATLGYEMDRHTPFSFDEVYFDYHVVKRFPESNLLYVMLITIKKDPVDYYLDLFKKINVKPRGIEITTTALFNVFQKANTPSEKVLDIAWIKKSAFFKERLLKHLVKLSPKLSELLKEPEEQEQEQNRPSINLLVEYLHNNSYELNLTSDCTLYFSRFFQSKDDTLDLHFQDIYNNGLKAVINLPYEKDRESSIRFLLSGKEMGKDYLEHVPEKIRPNFSVMRDFPIRIDKDDEETMPAVFPLLSVPIGLALKGLKSVPFDINFIPLQIRPKKKRSKKKILATAFIVLLFLFGGAYFINDIIKMNTHLAMLNEQLSELKLQVQSIEELQKEAERIERFSVVINNIKNNDIGKLKLLEELTMIIPDDSWLTEFKYTAKQSKVKLSGYAVSASKLIPLLEESVMFENVKFTSPITTDKRENKEKFRIEMTVSTGKNKS